MNYTDKQLLRSAQVAYYDINKEVIDEVNTWANDVIVNNGNEKFVASYTLNEIYNHSYTFRKSIYDSLSATCGFTVTANDDKEDVLNNETLEGNEAKKVAISAVYDIIGELQDDKAGSIGSWKLVSYVFNDDRPMNNNTPYFWFDEFCTKHNFRFCDIHSLRHLHASLLINAGVDMVAVSGDLGHSCVATTGNIYCHMFQEAKARNCDAITAALDFGNKKESQAS